ncbi:MAG: class I SAM-dependent methyltransferase [candidate division Zixibacteria bacterium]|nr:class I SAM-dependent methyltransferase [candidate division Zixibacteria bacterium]
MDNPSDPNPKKNRFEDGYFKRQYKNRLLFSGSDKPILYSAWRRKLAKKSHGRLLEVGCGEGNFLRRAQKDFNFACGADLSKEGLASAARHGLLLTRADAEKLPYKSACFDFLVAFDLVEHLPGPEKFFAEAARVLKNGGELVLTTPNPESLGSRLKKEKWFGHQDPTHCSIKNAGGWRKIFAAAGFEVISSGTDALWDSPYLPAIPAFLQKIFFSGLSNFFFLIEPYFPWNFGENLVFWLKKK